jgi:hypothetical protein
VVVAVAAAVYSVHLEVLLAFRKGATADPLGVARHAGRRGTRRPCTTAPESTSITSVVTT